MANVLNINGFIPHNRGNSGSNGSAVACYTEGTTNLNVGDMVKQGGSSSPAGTPAGTNGGLMEVDLATAGDAFCGVVVGIGLNVADLNITYAPSGTAMVVYVNMDKTQRYVCQVDEALSLDSVGLNANMIQTTAAASSTGKSGQELDASSAATTATLQWKIVEFLQSVNNTPNAVYNRVVVEPNNFQLGSHTGTLGV